MPTYSELLLSESWIRKREKIIHRDNLKCKNCFNEKLYSDEDLKSALLEQSNIIFPYVFGREIPTYKQVKFFRTHLLSQILTSNDLIVYYLAGDVNNIQLIRQANSEEVNEYKNRPDIMLNERIQKASHNDEEMQILAKMFNNDTLFENIGGRINFIPLKNNTEVKWHLVKGLNVHHTYYQNGLLPWEYPEKSLLTYCQICHEELHSNCKIPRLNEDGVKIEDLTTCYRCGGSGWIPQFKHVLDGICFKCWGAKYIELIQP